MQYVFLALVQLIYIPLVCDIFNKNQIYKHLVNVYRFK